MELGRPEPPDCRIERSKLPERVLSPPSGKRENHHNDYRGSDRPDAISADARTPEIDQKFFRHDTALHLKNMKRESFCQGVLSEGGIRQIVSND
jgi:hypothetical protein